MSDDHVSLLPLIGTAPTIPFLPLPCFPLLLPQDRIAEDEDHVQSSDVQAMQKL